MSLARTLATLAATVAVAGCGATPPQAPHSAAKKLDASTSDISTECGLSYQVTEFPGDHRKDLSNLERQAIASAGSLAAVYRENASWIYQGETVRDVVRDALSMLYACGLTEAERALRSATS